MRPGTWDGAVSTDNVRVTVNGTVRPVSGVRIQSGMRDGHPHADSGSWCVEATIEWVAPPLVFASAPHPFGGGAATEWLPKAGDSVVIETGDGALGQWWVQHRGMIDDTTGSFADGTAKSTTVDRIDDLDAAVHFGALLATMTPPADGFGKRRMGMQSTFLIDRTLRTVQGDTGAGWLATPPRTWQTVGSAPNQGSLWPEVGGLTSCGPKADSLSWSRTDYGVQPHGYEAEYRLTADASEPILTFGVPSSGGSGRSEFYVREGRKGYGVFAGVDHDAGDITFGTLSPGRTTHRIPRGSATRAALHAERNGYALRITVRTDDGRQVGPTTYDVSGLPIAWAADRVIVDAPGPTGWWMVENNKPASQRWLTLNHTPTARIRVGDMPWWSGTRDMPYENAAEWLAEQVDAECSAMWLDEDGVMQWAGRGVLEEQQSVNTVTSVRDVDDIQWESRRRSLARSVWLNYEEAHVDMDLIGSTRKTCWDSSTVDVPPGEANAEITNVTVPGDQDWISVDLNPHNPAADGSLNSHLEGSTYGGTQYRVNDAEEQSWALFCAATMKRQGLRNFEIKFWASGGMSSAYRVKTTYPKLENAFMAVVLDAELNLRARAITTWIKGERSVNAGSIGPARYTHDVGWRVQTVGSSDGLGDLISYLKTAVSSTRPRVTGLQIAHDPRHQVGDLITVQDQHVTGMEIVMLIQQRDIDVDDFTEKITGRVVAAYKMQDLNANGPYDRYSLHEPGGHTPITPESDWTRKAV